MKKLFTLFAAVAASFSAFAQTDISVTNIYYNETSTGEYMTNNAGPVNIEWTNLGDPINAGDTVFIFIQINGATLTAPGFLAPAGGYATGAVDTFNYQASTALPQATFASRLNNLRLLANQSTSIGGTPIGPNREIKAFVQLYRVGAGGVADVDANPANDTGSVSFNLVDGDFSATNLEVVSGNVNANDEIVIGETIDTVSFVWSNLSPLTHYEYSTTVEANIAGNLDTLGLALPRRQDPYGSFTGFFEGTGGNNTLTINIGIDPALLPTSTVGTFDICFRSLYAADADSTNDQVCKTFTVIDSTSTGLNDVVAEAQNIFMQNDLIIVEGVSRNQNVTVTNVAGQVVYTGVLNEGRNEIALNENTGLYIVQTEEQTTKVVKR